MSWPTTSDGQYYIFEGLVHMPVHPETGAPILLLRPKGGMGLNIPAIEKGDPGVHAEIDEAIDFTALEPGDATPDSAEWEVVTPPTTSTPGKWKLKLALHKGAKGDDGESVWDPTDLAETPVAGQIPVVNGDADGFELESMRVVDRCVPASISNSGSGDSNTTLCTITIPSRPYARRLIVAAQTIVTVASGEASVDLVARLNAETTGNVVARCFGVGAAADRLTIAASPPANSNDAFDKIAANSGATLYIRTELANGAGSYTTSNSTSLACAWAVPID